MDYVKVTMRPAGAAKRRSYWAVRAGNGRLLGRTTLLFRRCDAEGTFTGELLMAYEADVRPAEMDLHYGRLKLS